MAQPSLARTSAPPDSAPADTGPDAATRVAVDEIAGVAFLCEPGVGDGVGAVFPHLQFCVPAQCAMADVVRRGDASGLARAFARHAAGMAAVEDCGEVAVVGELAVELEEVVGNCVLEFRVPCDEAVANSLAPGTFKVWIKVAIADAMYA